MGRVMKASVCLGLVLAIQLSSSVSAGSADCPACPVKASDTISITALDVFDDASKICRELNPRNDSDCIRPIPFYFLVDEATREGALELLQEAYAELLEARAMGRGRVLVEEEAEPCNDKATHMAVELMQLVVNTEKLFPAVAEVLICAKALTPIPPTSAKTPLCNGSHAPKDHTPFLRQLIYSLRLVLNSILLYRISEE